MVSAGPLEGESPGRRWQSWVLGPGSSLAQPSCGAWLWVSPWPISLSFPMGITGIRMPRQRPTSGRGEHACEHSWGPQRS